jgi:hypothetical protein
LRDSRVSTRCCYGNLKNRLSFPRLPVRGWLPSRTPICEIPRQPYPAASVMERAPGQVPGRRGCLFGSGRIQFRSSSTPAPRNVWPAFPLRRQGT